MWKLLEPRSTAARTSGTDFGARRVKERASGGERRAASAGGLRVRIADHELRAVQAFAVIDLRAGQVLDAHRVDQQLHALVFHAGIAILFGLVELETVLHTRATATLNEHPQLEVRIAFATDQVADLAGGGIGKNECFGYGFSHGLHTTRRAWPPQPRGRLRPAFPGTWRRRSPAG